MGDQKNPDQQNPGYTDQEKKRENERAGQKPQKDYEKDQASNPERASGKTPSSIRTISRKIRVANQRANAEVSQTPPGNWRAFSFHSGRIVDVAGPVTYAYLITAAMVGCLGLPLRAVWS
jgi:hypothetical protein